jgi:hypothetical protein
MTARSRSESFERELVAFLKVCLCSHPAKEGEVYEACGGHGQAEVDVLCPGPDEEGLSDDEDGSEDDDSDGE